MNHTAVRPLPDQPNLDFLKDQAKRLLKKIAADDPASILLLRTYHPGYLETIGSIPKIALHDAQLIIARQYGCGSWNKLRAEVDSKILAHKSREERLLQAVWNGKLEDTQHELESSSRLSRETLSQLQDSLAGIADRSVWHRPQYRGIAKLLISTGVGCNIWTAARLGLLNQVQYCLEIEPSLLNAYDSQGRTPLQRAALIYGSDPECETIVDWLLQQGASVDIFTAAAYSIAETMQQELLRDTTQAHQKCQGSTPLNWAVRPRRHRLSGKYSQASDTILCEMLLDHGADLETQDDQENGMHPLHHVGEWCGSIETADLLIARGADLQALDDRGWTPLDYAINRNREPMIACFKRHGARQTLVDWPNTWGERRELIFASVKRNDFKSVERLLDEDPQLAQVRNEGGDTPLHWAAHDGHYEIAALLLKKGADVSAQETSYWGGSPLHWAAERQGVLVDLLLNHGAEINSLNHRTGQAPLHYCARCDDVPEVAELLLSRGADASIKDNRGNTALDYAIKANHRLVAAVLNRDTGKSR